MTQSRLLLLSISTDRGGAEEYLLKIGKGAKEEGWDTHVAFPTNARLQSLVSDVSGAGLQYHRLPYHEVGTRVPSAWFLWNFAAVLRLCRRLRPDRILFVLCGMQYGIPALCAAALLRIPTLAVVQLVRPGISSTRFAGTLRRALSRRQHIVYSAVSANNRALLSEYNQVADEDIQLVPNGINIDRYEPESPEVRQNIRDRTRLALGLNDETILLLTVGRLDKQKGYDILVPVIPHIVALHPQCMFVWVGDGPLEDSIREQVNRFQIDRHVMFLGRRGDVAELLLAADLFILPSRFEGTPFSLLEAMAASTPIVTSDAASGGDLLHDHEDALVCPTEDIYALREAVLFALSHMDDVRRYAACARERVDRFSATTMVAKTLSILNSITQWGGVHR